MIDLETFGVGHDAFIADLCILNMRDPSDYIRGRPNEQDGRNLDVGTVEWWLQQSNEARKPVINPPTLNLGQVGSFLEKFDEFWMWGMDFDAPILNHYLGVDPIIIKGTRSRDARTLCEAVLGWNRIKEIRAQSSHHDCYADCLAQRRMVVEVVDTLDRPIGGIEQV
jgi:hypothetical protein